MESDPKSRHVGYFVQIPEKNKFVGGLLVVTMDGDPVDFIHTEPVVLNSFLMALLDKRAEAYMIAKVLAESLINKAGQAPSVVLFEDSPLLLRTVVLPVIPVVIAPSEAVHKLKFWQGFELDNKTVENTYFWAPSKDVEKARLQLEEIQESMQPFSLREPFLSARQALLEIQKEPVRR